MKRFSEYAAIGASSGSQSSRFAMLLASFEREQAEIDLTQEFFARLLEKNLLGEKGRFRSFLLTALNHFLTDEWRKANAEKRGGKLLPLETQDAETRFSREPVERVTPETLFHQNWTLA